MRERTGIGVVGLAAILAGGGYILAAETDVSNTPSQVIEVQPAPEVGSANMPAPEVFVGDACRCISMPTCDW